MYKAINTVFCMWPVPSGDAHCCSSLEYDKSGSWKLSITKRVVTDAGKGEIGTVLYFCISKKEGST